MKTIEILGENRFEVQTKTRVACRGIVLSEGKLLLTYERNTDQYFIPGGGLEGEERLEEWFFVSHYFICEVQGETARKLTEREREAGLEPKWIPLEDAIEIFSRHQEYAATDEMKRGAYLREYEALLQLNTLDD